MHPSSVFTHYLITRFNIRVSTFGPEKMDSLRMDDTFIRQRLHLFSTYCVPAVLGQTVKDFTWLLYFDAETEPLLLEEVKKITAGPVPVQLVLVAGFEEFLSDIRDRIRHDSQTFCVTTRLDNDDILSADFIARVQHLFIPVHRTLINFTGGFEIDITHHLIKRWSTRYRNQFTSLIEKGDEPEVVSVYGFPHGAVPEDIQIINDGRSPGWAYTRHAYNYSPQKINARPVFSAAALSPFPSLQTNVKISWKHTLIYSGRWLWKTTRDRLKRYVGLFFRSSPS